MDYNTVIIGSGVSGMTAAIYLARANVSVCILEKDVPGGQITRTSVIDNYPGVSNIEGPDLAMNMYKQVTNLNVPYFYTEGLDIISSGDKYIVKTKDRDIICKNVIIATGRSPRRLDVDGEEKLIGRGISYCAICDGGLYKDRDVAVIGGGMSALEEAIYLSNICKSVILIHRRDGFRASSDLVDEAKSKDNISVLTDTNVIKFNELDGKLNSIVVSVENNNTKEIKVDGCFEYVGQIPNTDNFRNLGILDSDGYVMVDANYETSMKNIYAVGDCIRKELYQIITACNDGAVVASRIAKM